MATPGEEIAQVLSSEKEQHHDSRQFLTFLLGDEIYGVDILRVQEIKGWTPVTTIPNAPDYIKGVLNLRGEIVSIYDIRLRFNLDKADYNATTVIIVLTIKADDYERTVGLVVDGVWDVVNVRDDEIKDTPELGDNVDTRFISGLASIDDRNVILLNSDRLFTQQELADDLGNTTNQADV